MLGKKSTGGRRRPLRMAVQHMLPDALQFISGDYHDDDDDDHDDDDGDDQDNDDDRDDDDSLNRCSLTPWNIFPVMIRMILLHIKVLSSILGFLLSLIRQFQDT